MPLICFSHMHAHTHTPTHMFRVTLHYESSWMSGNLLETGMISEILVTETRFESVTI